MPDKMPADSRLYYLSPFLPDFLNVILSDIKNSGLDHVFNIMEPKSL